MPIKRNLYFALIIVLIAGLTVLFYCYNPAKYRFFPKCPFHSLTGLDCPGCGSQRAIYSLLHGDIKQALNYNVLLVMSIPFLLIHFSYRLRSVFSGKDLRWNLIYHPLTPKIIFLIVVVFWITRNIPVHPFNYLSADHLTK